MLSTCLCPAKDITENLPGAVANKKMKLRKEAFLIIKFLGPHVTFLEVHRNA